MKPPLLLLALATLPSIAAAGDSTLGVPLAQGATWPGGDIQQQLDDDPTLVPFGKGALFVPAMTNPLDEPPVTIWRDGRKIAESTTGRRVVLAPGDYDVLIGSGALEQQFTRRAHVQEHSTTIVPVSWAGLSLHVVDEQYNSVRASYELIRMDDLEYIGVGFGVDEQAGEPLSTWLLKPGLYKIVRVGDSYRARTSFATVRLLAGEHTHFVIVLDESTSTFVGAGEVTETDIFRPTDGAAAALVLGGDLSMNSRRNVLGAPDGESYALHAFLDSRLGLQLFDNPLVLRLQLEEGQAKSPGVPWQKTRDRADLDALYVYSWQPWIGPYVRFGAETNLFAGFRYFGSPRDVRVVDTEGNLVSERPAREQIRLSPPIGLITLKEGAGVNLRLLKTLIAEGTIRVGLGARHIIANDLLEEADSTATPEIDYRLVSSSNQFGVEGTLLAVARLTRWIIANVELDSLVPFETDSAVVIDANATLTLKLTEFASLNYVFRFLRDRSVSLTDEIEHDVLLRFSVALP